MEILAKIYSKYLILYVEKMSMLQYMDSSFRSKFIGQMISFREKFPEVYRSTECLAITISDKFQSRLLIESKA